MGRDFSDFYKRYEDLVGEVDKLFTAIGDQCPDEVRCEKGCADCCHALFDLTLIEALYINQAFNERFSGMERSRIMERADSADRKLAKLKRSINKASQEGKPANEIFAEVARTRVRCPMLADDDTCEMYDQRPITCRLYGVPTGFAGQAHTCGKSGFQAGTPYPTVNMDGLNERLRDLSRELRETLNTRYRTLEDMLMPLSMAILTEFTDDFLGVIKPKSDAKPGNVEIKAPAAAERPKGEACSSCEEDTSACSKCDLKTFTIGGSED